MNLSCPKCHSITNTDIGASQTVVVCSKCDAKINLVDMLSAAPDLEFEESRTRGIDGDSWEAQAGDTISHFRLDKVLGKGGFGVVYQAYDLQLNRNVAVKVPRVSAMTRLQADIFVREAQVAAQLQHPNIVSVHEVGREGDKVYIVSELIEGVTLKEWRMFEKPDQRQTAKIVSEIARGLHVAHAAGIVHRDVKPGNIIVDIWHTPHITDFGLAKEGSAQESPFKSGQVLGTTAYMSPEQGLGDNDSIDHRADIYSLGIVLYELLTGKRPSPKDATELKQLQEPKELEASIPNDLSSICMKAIARQPDERFQSCAEFADELTRFCQGLPTKTLPPTKVETAVRTVRKNSRYITLAVFGFLLGAVIFGVLWSKFGPKPDNAFPPNGQIFVEVPVSRPDCTVKAVKVDSERMFIDYANIIELESVSTSNGNLFKASLSPGWHIFEVVAPNGDIAEVWRLIPENLDDLPNDRFKSTNWTKKGEYQVQLNPIDVLPADTIRFVHCDGKSFEAGENSMATLPATRPFETIQMHDFLVAPYEVSLGDFYDVIGSTPDKFSVFLPTITTEPPSTDEGYTGEPAIYLSDLRGDEASSPDPKTLLKDPYYKKLAATNASFLEALEYAERVGGRLPVLEEYIFAATNGGETTYPWGNKSIFKMWVIDQVGLPRKDVTRNGIRNLFSNACEWTADVTMPTSQFKTGIATKQFESCRLVVGGAHMISGLYPGFDRSTSPRDAMPYMSEGDRCTNDTLGLRVYRSVEPRLNIDSELIQYYLRNRIPDNPSLDTPVDSKD